MRYLKARAAALAAVACGWGWIQCHPSSELVLVNADGSAFRRVRTVTGFARPAWGPNGSGLAYSSKACDGCPPSLFVTSLDGASNQLIVTDAMSPSWRH